VIAREREQVVELLRCADYLLRNGYAMPLSAAESFLGAKPRIGDIADRAAMSVVVSVPELATNPWLEAAMRVEEGVLP
jgi:hypothetical protein